MTLFMKRKLHFVEIAMIVCLAIGWFVTFPMLIFCIAAYGFSTVIGTAFKKKESEGF